MLRPYDERALREIARWKRPSDTRRGRWGDRIDAVVTTAASMLPTSTIEPILTRVTHLAASISTMATSESAVLRAYARGGHPVPGIDAIAELPLEAVDGLAGGRRVKDVVLGTAEGAGTGFYGAPAIPVDIAGLLAVSLRAVQARGLAYGFRPGSPEEIAYAVGVLEAASQFGPAGKQVTRAAVNSQVGRKVAARVGETVLSKVTARVAAMKTQNAAPVIGAVTGGAFNGWYLAQVGTTSRMAYRERHLHRTYGRDMLVAYGVQG